MKLCAENRGGRGRRGIIGPLHSPAAPAGGGGGVGPAPAGGGAGRSRARRRRRGRGGAVHVPVRGGGRRHPRGPSAHPEASCGDERWSGGCQSTKFAAGRAGHVPASERARAERRRRRRLSGAASLRLGRLPGCLNFELGRLPVLDFGIIFCLEELRERLG